LLIKKSRSANINAQSQQAINDKQKQIGEINKNLAASQQETVNEQKQIGQLQAGDREGQ